MPRGTTPGFIRSQVLETSPSLQGRLPRDLDLDAIYAIPDQMDTWEQHLKWTHGDLEGMDRAHLYMERERLHLRLLLDRHPHPWLRERFVAIREAIARVR